MEPDKRRVGVSGNVREAELLELEPGGVTTASASSSKSSADSVSRVSGLSQRNDRSSLPL
jgi:hypothetical protein